jgi:hypothetical protein
VGWVETRLEAMGRKQKGLNGKGKRKKKGKDKETAT